MLLTLRTAVLCSLLVSMTAACGARSAIEAGSGSEGAVECMPGTCPPGTTCGTSISADMMTQPTSWTFNGTASWSPGAGVLTTDDHSEAGTIIYQHAIYTDAFDLTFEVSLGDGDGVAFMLQTNGANALGSDGGGLGVAGLDGFAIELDTYQNSDCGDIDDQHLGVDDLSSVCGMAIVTSSWTTSLAGTSVDLHDGQWHSVKAHVEGGVVDLAVDSAQFSGIPIPGWQDGVSYWYGFAGSTGLATAQQQIRNVEIQFGTPRCL